LATTTETVAVTEPTQAGLWLRALRAPFLVASVLPVLLGILYSFIAVNRFSLSLAIATLVGAVFFHLATNMLNDNFDYRSGNDLAVKHQNPFAGGGRVLTTGRLSLGAHLGLGLGFFAAGTLLGLWLFVQMGGWDSYGGRLLLLIGMVGAGSSLFYVAPPLRLAHHGIGEVVVGLSFGPLVVMGSYIVQTGTFSWSALLLSLAPGLLVAGILWINEFPDLEADSSVGKRTLIVRMGLDRALTVYVGLIVAAFVIPVLSVLLRLTFGGSWFTEGPPFTVLLPLATVPLALKTIEAARRNYQDPMALIPANAGTIGLTVLFSLLLILGVGLGYWLP